MERGFKSIGRAGRWRRRSGAGGVALLAVLLATSPCVGRQVAVVPDSQSTAVGRDRGPGDRVSFSRLVVPATLGSAAGTLAGVLFGEQLGWGGGDDPGVESALIFGMLGGALGSATGVVLARPGEDPSAGATWSAAGVGVLGGLAGAWTLTLATEGEGVMVGFVVGQGVVTAAIASAIAN